MGSLGSDTEERGGMVGGHFFGAFGGSKAMVFLVLLFGGFFVSAFLKGPLVFFLAS